MAPSSEHRHIPFSRGFTLGAIAVVAIAAGWYLRQNRQPPLHSSAAKSRPAAEAAPLSRDEDQTIRLFEEASPSVVYITSLSVRQNAFNLDIFEIPQGTGSGFLWDDQGYIVTNFHVIQEASGATVTLSDQSTWTAQLVGVEPDKDIAVLKINAPSSRLRPIKIGSSRGLRVGQRVLAIGNPFGLDHTLTEGLISGLGREIKSVTERPIQGMIQTDAAINPGNSGGPLLDSSGRLIGMNTAIMSPSGSYSGIGFAVPIDTINRIVPQIIRSGKVSKPGLGLRVLESPMLRSRGIVGAVVADVLAGSPAAEAGLVPARRYEDGIRLGDVILAINEKPVESGEDLFLALDEFTPGQEVVLLVDRDGKKRKVSLRLGVLGG